MERRAAEAERRLAELEARLAALTKLGGGAGAPAGASTAASAADAVSPAHLPLSASGDTLVWSLPRAVCRTCRGPRAVEPCGAIGTASLSDRGQCV
jgi:hypothetical protein